MNRLDKTERRPLRIDLSRTFIRRTDLSDANLEGTNLTGADLSDARKLALEQLDKAVIDDTTTLPAYPRS